MIRRATRETFNQKQIGAAMADAFFTEPNFVYVVPDEEIRRSALTWFFGEFVSTLGLLKGEVYTTEDGLGKAVWIAPGQQVGLVSAMQAGFLSLPMRFGFDGFVRFMKLGSDVEALRKETAPDKHWYLMALGVSPEQQGRGRGSSLIQRVLAQADQERTPCYLETFRESNLTFYRKQGFEVTKQASVKGGPVFWGMVR